MLKAILFDLGGVLIKLGESPLPANALPDGQAFTLRDWFSSDSAIRFEKGLISPAEFAQNLKDDLSIEIECAQILAHFSAWPKGLYPGVTTLLENLKTDYPLYVLSNSNELHWPRILNEFGLSQYFQRMFASHIINKAKPNADAYHHVITQLGLKPEEILFFDDNLNNVEAAKEQGLLSHHVNGFAELSQILKSLKLI